MLEEKMAVIEEVHTLRPNEIISLEHDKLVLNSFVSNAPVVVNYKEGKVRILYIE